MELGKRDETNQKATDAAVRRFVELAVDLEGSFDFEEGMKAAESIFRHTVMSIEAERGVLSESIICFQAFEGWWHCSKIIRERCHKELLLLEKERSVEQIRRTTAEVVIEPEIKKIGLPYQLEFQKFRLKILLRISYDRHFEFYIKYRNFNNPEILNGLSERTSHVLEYIQMFGPQLSLKGNHQGIHWIDPEADR